MAKAKTTPLAPTPSIEVAALMLEQQATENEEIAAASRKAYRACLAKAIDLRRLAADLRSGPVPAPRKPAPSALAKAFKATGRKHVE